jgi:hypothetical protein
LAIQPADQLTQNCHRSSISRFEDAQTLVFRAIAERCVGSVEGQLVSRRRRLDGGSTPIVQFSEGLST